jgi:hypothetical protein
MEKLIYAILSVKSNPEKINLFLSGVQGIGDIDLNAVSVNELSTVVCSLHKADFIADKLNAIAYAGVIDALAKEFTLLPMRFGSFMGSDEEIVGMLERNYDSIRQNLEIVENKYEFGLKVFCDPEQIRIQLSEDLDAGKDSALDAEEEKGNSVFRTYINKKLKEHRLEESRLKFADSVISMISDRLSEMNAISKFKKIITETNIIDALFLLDKERKDELINTIIEIQNHYAGLKFVLTGPWPPYSFVDVAIK